VAGTSNPIECPEGFYNDLLYARVLTDCKMCQAGMYCDLGTADDGVICPEGYVCPRGATIELNEDLYLEYARASYTPCPPGTYGGYMEGKKSIDECLVCPPGYICGSATTEPEAVPPGYY
jgi:hypothetical protein